MFLCCSLLGISFVTTNCVVSRHSKGFSMMKIVHIVLFDPLSRLPWLTRNILKLVFNETLVMLGQQVFGLLNRRNWFSCLFASQPAQHCPRLLDLLGCHTL